jgi:hypothetical protein
MLAVRADAVKVFPVERADWADQCDSGHDFFSTHFDISYLPQTKPARKHFTKVTRKTLLTYMGAKPLWLFVRKTLFLHHNSLRLRWLALADFFRMYTSVPPRSK